MKRLRLLISLLLLGAAGGMPVRVLADVGASSHSTSVSALARAVFAAMDTRDFEKTGALLDESFQLHYQGVPGPISKGSLLEMLRSYYVSFPDTRHDLQAVLPSGSYVTVRVVVSATHRGTYEGIAATGRQVAVGGIHILRVANGKVVEWWPQRTISGFSARSARPLDRRQATEGRAGCPTNRMQLTGAARCQGGFAPPPQLIRVLAGPDLA